jgi:fused signal recognition particle receptor
LFSFLRRPQQVKTSLTKTRQSFLSRLSSLVAKNELNEDFWMGLEETLIAADMGVDTTMSLVDKLRARVDKEHIHETARVQEMLQEELVSILESAGRATEKQPADSLPHVILIVGVNGSGKTTSIAKLAHFLRTDNKKVLLAAGDTFRAAAIDQLKIWAERVGTDVVAHQPGADPGAVAYDAWQSANARHMDYLIVDTAGRLQTKVNLMKELEKIARVLQKNDPTAPHETLLVLDAVTGQNGLQQARAFKEATPVTGLILAKLDSTAKGGIVFAIAKELGIPIKYIGTGEGIDDFAVFDAKEFVDGLFE